MNKPFISICIPSYKRVEHLINLLDSIAIQNFRDFEVVLTDDSPTDEVKAICLKYVDKLPLHYFKNESTLGTPENWNESIRKASGEWIKIMHDDDWFSNADSLESFAIAARENSDAFIFSSFINFQFSDNTSQQVSPSSFRLRKLKQDPVILLSRNCIGVPSVTMYKKEMGIQYDPTMKWLVDIDFYIRLLEQQPFKHIDKPLINVGFSENQLTTMFHNKPEIEIPEYVQLLKKTGTKHLKNMLVYDAWWRLLRNFQISNFEQLQKFANEDCPIVLKSIIKDVNRWPHWLLKLGPVSKILMSISYYSNKQKIKESN